jgi:biopolymer transport protein ExbD
MAISTGNGGNGRGGRRSMPSISDINVTPFVDVLLVLLVIFMLTASVMELGIEIDVPKVRVQRDSSKELPSTLQAKFKGQKQAYVRADREATFELVAQVLAELGEAGIGVNVVTRPVDESGRKRK